MGITRVAPAAPPTEAEKLASFETALCRTSILNWDCTRVEDVPQLARNARAASALARLAYMGMRAVSDEGEPTDDHEAELVADLLHLADHLGYVLARKLGAVEVA